MKMYTYNQLIIESFQMVWNEEKLTATALDKVHQHLRNKYKIDSTISIAKESACKTTNSAGGRKFGR